MSSLRNAVQRRNHRERDQPTERKKWGLLEKRKDYKLRAADHKTKQRKIKALQTKASERNEDEFYFGMMSSTTENGVRRSKRGEENAGGGGKSLDLDVVNLMKTQDQGYLQTMLQRTRRERKRLEEDVLLGERGVKLEPGGGRIVFGDDEDDEGVPALPAPAKREDEDFDMDLDGFDDESASEHAESDDEDLTPEQRSLKRKKRHALQTKRRKLDALKEQEEKLSAALDGLDHQRAKMNGTIGGVNKNGVSFKPRQRKR
ncbi:U3 small nucleolar RNA-associated protein 11 [Fulvia fulva]|nr:U3 small nucleolar RNA-associated protein 11 [Fulvia fulva]WPV15311.1 U3 small nucleolar RNA-associated protein 11 [Fulvia fulva]WPV29919.1 U3 small nucleolar RNA-associated protein 11 [Fulvia fulva]